MGIGHRDWTCPARNQCQRFHKGYVKLEYLANGSRRRLSGGYTPASTVYRTERDHCVISLMIKSLSVLISVLFIISIGPLADDRTSSEKLIAALMHHSQPNYGNSSLLGSSTLLPSSSWDSSSSPDSQYRSLSSAHPSSS